MNATSCNASPATAADRTLPLAHPGDPANGFGDIATVAWPAADELHEAGGRRAFAQRIFAAAIALARGAHARLRARRHAKAVYDALAQLDDRSLRDIGLDRAELRGIARRASRPGDASAREARPARWPWG